MQHLKLSFFGLMLTSQTLFAQIDTSRWHTFTHHLYTISYPKTDWVYYADSLLRVEFVLATKATIKKPYDRDRLMLRVKDNYDGIYGDMAEYASQNDAIANNKEILFSKLIEKNKLVYYEKVKLNTMGKVKRKVKSRVFFINKNFYELEFDATETAYPSLIGQVDSIFDSFSPKDFNATVATSWLVFDKPIYTIKYPSNWQMAAVTPAHAEFMLNKPKKSSDKGYWDNVYLMVNNFKTTVPELNSYTQSATAQLKASLKNAVIHSSKKRKTANFTCQEVISEGNLGSYLVKMKQWHIVKGKRAFTLTYAARVESFDEVADVIEEMFNSFQPK